MWMNEYWSEEKRNKNHTGWIWNGRRWIALKCNRKSDDAINGFDTGNSD